MGVRTEEHDIEKDDASARQHRALGGSGVPLIDVEGIIIRGYDEDQIRAAVERRSKEPKP